MFKFLFGRRNKAGKSVNQVRGRRAKAETPTDPLEARIKARRAQNLRMADIKAALASAKHVPKPDVSGALFDAKFAAKSGDFKDCRDVIDQALRLQGSQRTLEDTLAHPTRRYLALAVIRGLLEGIPDAANVPDSAASDADKSDKPRRKP